MSLGSARVASVLKWFGIGILGLIALVAVALAFLDTGPGHRFVADRIAALSFQNGMRIGVDEIDGSIYGKATIKGMTLYDPHGAFFRAPVVKLDWNPFNYARNHLDIRSLVAPQAELLRRPQFKATPPSKGPLLPNLDITVGRFQIARLRVDKPVTGDLRVGAVAGTAQIADGRAQVHLDAKVIGAKDRPGGDRISLALDAVPSDNKLDLNAFVSAPAGGVIASMAGLNQQLRLRVQGKGDWKHWDGRLAADLGQAPLARLGLIARNGTFGVKGLARPARLLSSGPLSTLLGPVTFVDLKSSWRKRSGNIAGRISSDSFALDANGGVDLGRSRFDNLHVKFALARPSAIAPNLAGQDVRAAATLNGAITKPDVDYSVTAAQLRLGSTSVAGLRANGSAHYQRDHFAVPIHARAAAIAGLDTVAGGSLRNISIDGDLAVDWPRILSDNLRIRSDRIDATAMVLANVSTGLYSGALQGRIANYRVDSVGIFNVGANANLKSGPAGLSLDGTVRARSTKLLNGSVARFVGGKLVASTHVNYGPDGVVRLSGIRMTSPKLRIAHGSGRYSTNGAIALQASGESSQYGPVSIRITGTATRPNIVVNASRPGLGLGISGLQATIARSGNGYGIKASGLSSYGPFSADVMLATGGGSLSITARNIRFAGIDFAGRLRQSASGPFAGQLTARGNGVDGLVRLSAAGKYQHVQAHLTAHQTVLPGAAGVSVGAAKIDADVILYDQPQVVADVQLADSTFGSFRISAARALVDYRNGRGSAKAIVEGRSGVPFRVAVNADLQPRLWRVALAGRANGINFHTADPARIVPDSAAYTLEPVQIQFDQGSVRVAGRYGAETRLLASLDSLDLSVVNSFAPGLGLGGHASGTIRFDQSGNGFPTAQIRLAVRDFTRTTAAAVSEPTSINLLVDLQASRATLDAVMRTRGTVIGRLQASADPLGPGRGWTERVALAPLSGGMRYLGPADTLFSFAGLADQTLKGPLAVAADFHCRVNAPCLQGVVHGKGLAYDNLTYGTHLTAMSLNGQFSRDRLEIRNLTGQAGDGTVTGSGYISLAASRGYPAKVDLKLHDARLANSDDLRVTATGQLQLVKPANQQPVLKGTIRLPSTRYQIARQGAAEVPTLTGVHFKPPRQRPRVTGDAAQTPTAAFGDIALDLHIVAPNQLYVSGMGLESEWSADLSVTGTSSDPRIAGSVRLVRGTLGFAGHSFDLADGRIRFQGGSGSNAVISLTAEDTINDVDITINVSGSVSNPRISFSSSPGLPQDEILSRILFGNSVGSLSALQAVQLAASLNSLRGSGGGLNPIGKLRAATGFDRLRILGADQTTGRGTAIAAGKYITNDIYLEIITDARGYTATQLEVALTPSLSILSRAGGTSGTNLTVRYKKSY